MSVPQTHSSPSSSHLILLSPPGPRIPSSKMPRLVLMLQPIFPFPPSNFIFFPFQSSTILKSPSKPQCDFVVLRLILPPTNLVQFPQMPLKVPSKGTINQLSHIVSLIPRNPTSRLCSAASRQSPHLLPASPNSSRLQSVS